MCISAYTDTHIYIYINRNSVTSFNKLVQLHDVKWDLFTLCQYMTIPLILNGNLSLIIILLREINMTSTIYFFRVIVLLKPVRVINMVLNDLF